MNKSDDEKSVYIKLLNSYKNFRESYPKLSEMEKEENKHSFKEANKNEKGL